LIAHASARKDLGVCLVQMPRWSIRTPPFSIALLTAVLRQRGFTVYPKDYDIEFYRKVEPEDRWAWTGEEPVDWGNPTAFARVLEKYDHLFDETVEDILATGAQVVGFSVKVWSLEFSREVARRLKARRPDVFVIFGGPDTNKGPEEHLVGHPEVDAICLQEADTSFPDFLEAFQDNGMRPVESAGFVHRDEGGELVDGGKITRPPQVDEIPFADFSDFDFDKYLEPNLLNLVLSRGCVFRCTFCSEAPAFLKYRSYVADRILAEVEHVLATSNVRQPLKIEFNDSLLNGDLKALEGLADGILERGGAPFQWGGMMALRKQMSDELVHKLARAGCTSIFVGMESGSPKVIRAMRKGHDLPTAKRLTKAMHEAGVSLTVSIVTGYPGEGEEEFYETLEALREIAPSVDTVMLHSLALSTGSLLTSAPEKFGIDPSTITGHDSWDWVSEDGKNTPQVRLQRLFTLQHMLHGKIIDYGGTMDRQKGLYNPFEQIERRDAERRKLLGSLFRSVRLMDVEAPSETALGFVEQQGLADDGSGLRVSGWARSAASKTPAACVVVLDEEGRVLGHAFCDRRHEEAARRLDSLGNKHFGWQLVLDPALACGGLRVGVYEPDSGRVFQFGALAEAEPTRA
jgi:anaerobic magnesium-protoporphyrin IX monomethyl ester cyclase